MISLILDLENLNRDDTLVRLIGDQDFNYGTIKELSIYNFFFDLIKGNRLNQIVFYKRIT